MAFATCLAFDEGNEKGGGGKKGGRADDTRGPPECPQSVVPGFQAHVLHLATGGRGVKEREGEGEEGRPLRLVTMPGLSPR